MAGGVVVRGLGAAWRFGRGVLGSKMTLGSTLAVATAPITLPIIDNATGNVASEAILDSPLGRPLEALMRVNEYAHGEQAGMVSNAIEKVMHDHDQLDENSPDYETQLQIIDVTSHLIVQDHIGAFNKASSYGIDPSDIVAAYNEERALNPDASLREIGPAAVQNAARRVRERKEELERNGERTLTDRVVGQTPFAAAATAAMSGETSEEEEEVESTARTVLRETINQENPIQSNLSSVDIEQLSSDSLSNVFDAATDRMGFMGMIVKGISALAGIFGQNAQEGFQRMVLGSVESETRYAALQTASQAGNLVSRMGNPFNLGRDQGLTLEHG